MEKSVMKTLLYADIFNYPLKAWEIHKWLIGQSLSLQQVEKILEKLIKKSKVGFKKDLYFLKGRDVLIYKRLNNKKQSNYFIKKAKVVGLILKIIPWIKLVGVSGGLALDNASKDDDIDLFIVSQNQRLWLCRILILTILSFLGVRRKRKDKKAKAAGKICVNLILEEDNLMQKNKDVFTAHEVLQMKLLWQRGNVYQRYLEDNDWAFKFLPNWASSVPQDKVKYKGKQRNFSYIILGVLEIIAKRFQLKIMGKPLGLERIENGALYLHPSDYRLKVLLEYKKRLIKYYN